MHFGTLRVTVKTVINILLTEFVSGFAAFKKHI